MEQFLTTEFLGNSGSDYLLALLIIFFGVIGVQIFKKIVIQKLKHYSQKTKTQVDDILITLGEKYFIPIAYVAVFYSAIGNLTLHPILSSFTKNISILLVTFFGIRFLNELSEYGLLFYAKKKLKDNPNLEKGVAAFIPALRIFIWTVAIVFLLDNLGLNIAAMVASLGIGGVAIALASQGILQDLFSYFSILFDRPFEIGDLVQIDNYIGHIEYVGIKTTRIKELSGEELILANTDLTSSRIQNFKRMERRRVVFMIGVIYETDLDTLQIIPSLIQKAIEATENVIFDRAHFANYNDFSLDFEITYYVLNNSYLSFREAQQSINFKLKEAFDKHNIQFAYPTQVAYLNPMSSNTLDQSDKLSPS